MHDPITGEIVPRTEGLPDFRQHERSVARIENGRVRVDHYYHQSPAPVNPATPPDDILKRATPILVVAFICVILFAMVAALLMMLIPPFLLMMIAVAQSVVALVASVIGLVAMIAIVAVAISGSLGHLRKTADTSKVTDAMLKDRKRGRRR
jgi:hypothetical protein